MGIIKDIKSGALPASEFPGFAWWLVKKSFWFFFAVLIIGGGIVLLVK